MPERSIAVASLLLMLTPAVAGPDSDIVRKFGLFGTWAVDCSKPPSGDNTYEEYTPSETGYPTRTWYRKKGDRYAPAQSFEMRNARIAGPDRISVATPIGTTVIEAQEMSVDGPVKASVAQ